ERFHARITVEPDVIEFVREDGMVSDYAEVLSRLDEMFSPKRISVEVMISPNDGKTKDLIFSVACDLDYQNYRETLSRFYGRYCDSKPPIFFVMAVLRDFTDTTDE